MLLRAQIPAPGCLAVCGCGDHPGRPPAALELADPSLIATGDVRLYCALTLNDDLPPAIAGSYNIVQRPNLALPTITIAPAAGAGTERPSAIEVPAESVPLIGERQALSLRLVNEPGGSTYLAPVTVPHREPITIEIPARTVTGAPEIAARRTGEFYLE